MTGRKPIQIVLIYGYGVMGKGVSATFADAGFETIVKSSRASELSDLPNGVTAVADLPETAPDLVIEFVPEDAEIKQRVFAEIEDAYPDDEVIIATGTSGASLVDLGAKLKRPHLFTGIHYFMPPTPRRWPKSWRGRKRRSKWSMRLLKPSNALARKSSRCTSRLSGS